MKIARYIVMTGAVACASLNGSAGAPMVSPTVSEIAQYVTPRSVPAQPARLTFMPDGKSYATLSADGRTINVTPIAGGESTVLFDVTNTRETQLASIEGFTLSDDASKILVWTDWSNVYRRSGTASYYVYEVRTRLLRPLSRNHKRQQSPMISPNGRMVAFAAENNIYVAKLDYQTEVPVTTDGELGKIINGTADWTYEEEFTTTCSMSWAPDNSMLCYLRYDESDVPTYTLPIYQGTCHPHNEYTLYPGQMSYKYPVAGQPNAKVTLHSYDVETRKVVDLALPDQRIEYIPRIHFGPSAAQLMVVTLNRDQNRMEIYSVNPRSTVAKSIYTEESRAWITPETYENIMWGPDNFALLTSSSGWCCVSIRSYTGSEVRNISAGEADITDYYGADAAGNHYYQAAAPTPMDRTVWRLDRKGVASTIFSPTGTTSIDFGPGMTYGVMKYSDTATPPVYTMVTPAGKKVSTLEDNKAYASRYAAIPQKEFFTMVSEGYTLNGFVVRPRDFDSSRHYPVIMYQYSGPDSQSVLNAWAMDWYYYYAEQGYIVMCVDGRGTGGRGREFAQVVYRNLGYYETIDQMAAARYAARQPGVDPKRIGIFGWSYGGYEALMAASADDCPYAAAVAVAPVTSWRFYDTVYTERYMLTPQQNDEGYNTSAPLMHAAHLGCPLLMMTGTADDNVHPANTLQYISVLQSMGILCDLWEFPNMNHSINGCNARSLVYARMLQFFDSHLKSDRR